LQDTTTPPAATGDDTPQAAADAADKARERARYWQKVAPLLIRHSLRKGMPFGPMLAIGAVAALLWGASLNSLYMRALNPEPAVATSSAASEISTPPALPQ
jgi:hypothetical protein